MDNAKGGNKSKRRSSFFQRRYSTCTPESLHSSSGVRNESNQCDKEEERKLTAYINNIQNEKEEWNYFLIKLKKGNNDFKAKCSQVVDHTSNLEYLNEDDKKFLKERPDYAGIGRLLDSTAEALALKQHCILATSEKLSNLTEKLNQINYDVTEKIITRTMTSFDEFDLLCEDSESDVDSEANILTQ